MTGSGNGANARYDGNARHDGGSARKGVNMSNAVDTPNQPIDITAPPRAVLSATVRLLYRVLGEERLGTARGNAWAAVCADQQRAATRAEVQRMLAAARDRR